MNASEIIVGRIYIRTAAVRGHYARRRVTEIRDDANYPSGRVVWFQELEATTGDSDAVAASGFADLDLFASLSRVEDRDV